MNLLILGRLKYYSNIIQNFITYCMLIFRILFFYLSVDFYFIKLIFDTIRQLSIFYLGINFNIFFSGYWNETLNCILNNYRIEMDRSEVKF